MLRSYAPHSHTAAFGRTARPVKTLLIGAMIVLALLASACGGKDKNKHRVLHVLTDDCSIDAKPYLLSGGYKANYKGRFVWDSGCLQVLSGTPTEAQCLQVWRTEQEYDLGQSYEIAFLDSQDGPAIGEHFFIYQTSWNHDKRNTAWAGTVDFTGNEPRWIHFDEMPRVDSWLNRNNARQYVGDADVVGNACDDNEEDPAASEVSPCDRKRETNEERHPRPRGNDGPDGHVHTCPADRVSDASGAAIDESAAVEESAFESTGTDDQAPPADAGTVTTEAVEPNDPASDGDAPVCKTGVVEFEDGSGHTVILCDVPSGSTTVVVE